MSSENSYSFFQSVEKSFDKAAIFTTLGPRDFGANKSLQ